MPKKTFYLSEDDLAIYEKAKKIAGDSISSTIIQGLKQFVAKWEEQEFGYTEIQLFEGVEYYRDQYSNGQEFKFVGKQLAKVIQEHGPGQTTIHELYLTRKGKFLVYIILDEPVNDKCTRSKHVKNTISELKEMKLPPALFTEADKAMPSLFIEVLDI